MSQGTYSLARKRIFGVLRAGDCKCRPTFVEQNLKLNFYAGKGKCPLNEAAATNDFAAFCIECRYVFYMVCPKQ